MEWMSTLRHTAGKPVVTGRTQGHCGLALNGWMINDSPQLTSCVGGRHNMPPAT